MKDLILIGYDEDIDALDDLELDPYIAVVIDVESEDVLNALAYLPDDTQRIVVHRFGLGAWSLSRNEVADMLGFSLDEVVYRERNGVAHLRQLLGGFELKEAA